MRVPENFLYYLSAHMECNERLLALAESMSAEDLEVSVDPTALRLKRMISSVVIEVHRMKGFVRLKPLGARILYGYLKPRHRIGWHVSDNLAQSNPGTIVVLGNGFESWTSLFSGGKVLRHHGKGLAETLEGLATAFDASEENLELEGIWRIYYESQYCPQRRNLGAFQRRMPRRALEESKLTIERNRNGATLDDFFGKND